MHTLVNSRSVRLPEDIARKLKGKRIEFRERKDGVLLATVDDPISAAKGALKGKGFSTKQYLRQKRSDKRIEA
jgi:hypothetical protein